MSKKLPKYEDGLCGFEFNRPEFNAHYKVLDVVSGFSTGVNYIVLETGADDKYHVMGKEFITAFYIEALLQALRDIYAWAESHNEVELLLMCDAALGKGDGDE